MIDRPVNDSADSPVADWNSGRAVMCAAAALPSADIEVAGQPVVRASSSVCAMTPTHETLES